MTKDNNYSAEPVWDENDDLAEMMDAVLRAPGLRSARLPNPDCSWAMFIGDKDMEEGINSLPPLWSRRFLSCFFLKDCRLWILLRDWIFQQGSYTATLNP